MASTTTNAYDIIESNTNLTEFTELEIVSSMPTIYNPSEPLRYGIDKKLSADCLKGVERLDGYEKAVLEAFANCRQMLQQIDKLVEAGTIEEKDKMNHKYAVVVRLRDLMFKIC